MAKKPMNVEEALDALGAVDGGVMQDAVAVAEPAIPAMSLAGVDVAHLESRRYALGETVAFVNAGEPARAQLSPAEEFAKWVAGLEWAAAYSDSVTRLLEEIQKRARALL